MHTDLIYKMTDLFFGDPKRVQHFLKVHEFARLICEGESLDEETKFLIETTAILHDCGIRPAELKYGTSHGKLQEQEGPLLAKTILKELEYDKKYGDVFIERVCFLIGHHHTYSKIDGIDYRILVESDFLVNFYEDEMSEKEIREVYKTIFKTKTGRHLAKMIYNLDYTQKDPRLNA